MSIHAITGVMGSGKSHEAVKEKLAPALAADATRRVITNIEGLNYEAIADYVKRPLDEVKRRLVSVSYERVSEPGFWYDPDGGTREVRTQGPEVITSVQVPPSIDSVVQPGDLVIVDEMWRYFNRGTKLPDDAMRFFRMHRHYADPSTGQTCDVVLINQAMRGIHQDLRDVVEVQFNCRKLKALGRPQNYQVFVIEGGERKPSHQFLRKYDPKVFPLYSSYASANATESVDKRQSALNTGFFKFVVPGALLAILAGLYGTFSYFHNMGQTDPLTGKPLSAAPAPVPASSPGSPPAAPAGAPLPVAPPGPLGTAGTASPDDWRLAARYVVAGLPVVVLVDGKGRYRTLTTGDLVIGAGNNDISIQPPKDAPRLTPWTGASPTYSRASAQGATK